MLLALRVATTEPTRPRPDRRDHDLLQTAFDPTYSMSCWRKDSDECWGTDEHLRWRCTVDSNDAPRMCKTSSQVDYYSQDTVDTNICSTARLWRRDEP